MASLLLLSGAREVLRRTFRICHMELFQYNPKVGPWLDVEFRGRFRQYGEELSFSIAKLALEHGNDKEKQ